MRTSSNVTERCRSSANVLCDRNVESAQIENLGWTREVTTNRTESDICRDIGWRVRQKVEGRNYPSGWVDICSWRRWEEACKSGCSDSWGHRSWLAVVFYSWWLLGRTWMRYRARILLTDRIIIGDVQTAYRSIHLNIWFCNIEVPIRRIWRLRLGS